MIEKNDEFELEIERLGVNGEGIGEKDGIVVFVPFSLVGERVLVHVIKVEKSFVVAKILKLLVASNDRVKPRCEHFGKCGGCDLQHLSYQKQLEFKKELVFGTLKKYAGIEQPVLDVIASNNEFRYRNKFAFPVQGSGSDLKIGMYQKNSHKIVPVSDCLLQSERAQRIVEIFKEFMIKTNLSGYDEETKQGLVKHIVVRENESGFVLTVVLTENKDVDFGDLIEAFKNEFDKFGIVKNVNNLKNNVIFGNLDLKIFGDDELEFNEFGIKYFVNNRSFLQVNTDVKNKIYKIILDELTGEKNIIDAYSGAGLLSSILTKTGANVIGVEIIKEATQNAEKLKKLNFLNNLTNKNGDCSVIIPVLAKQFNGDFSVVVDPPRKGLSADVVDAFLKSKPKKIIYLSCNPATLARDLKTLLNDYEISFVQPADMFPQTSQVETLVSLKRK